MIVHFPTGDSDNYSADPIATLRFPGMATLPGTFTSELTNRNSTTYKQIELNFCNEVSDIQIDCKHLVFLLEVKSKLFGCHHEELI